MRNPAYYNEHDKYAAAWLRNLIAAGHIAPGDVDERSITDVRPDDLRPYGQCHFFAGIGGWSYALRLAGVPDDRPVWTGSCPCQPFSAAGAQRGSDDERHLWPAFFDLIRECHPASVFGEQVAGAAGLAWVDHVCADLEGAGYAAAAADLCAAGAGAFHIRQRLYWVAHAGSARAGRDAGTALGEKAGGGGARGADGQRCGDASFAGGAVRGLADSNAPGCSEQRLSGLLDGQRPTQRDDADGCGALNMAHAAEPGRSEQPQRHGGAHGRTAQEPRRLRDAGELADPNGGHASAERQRRSGEQRQQQQAHGGSSLLGNAGNEGLQIERRFPGVSCAASGDDPQQAAERAGALDAWARIEWLQCSDGKARPTEPGLFPLAHGVSNRVGRLRAYGNAIVPQVAAAFVMAAA